MTTGDLGDAMYQLRVWMEANLSPRIPKLEGETTVQWAIRAMNDGIVLPSAPDVPGRHAPAGEVVPGSHVVGAKYQRPAGGLEPRFKAGDRLYGEFWPVGSEAEVLEVKIENGKEMVRFQLPRAKGGEEVWGAADKYAKL